MSYAFIHATVLDGTEKMKPMLDTTVLVDDKGKIVEVGPTAKVKMRGGEQIIDLQGKYLIPGLINMHVHLVGDSARPQFKQRRRGGSKGHGQPRWHGDFASHAESLAEKPACKRRNHCAQRRRPRVCRYPSARSN